jgi:outer membrane murein-binding lipoprotein Lpp
MKRMSWFFGAVVVGVMALTGCSSEEKSDSTKTASAKGNLTVQGSVSSKLGTDNARAVAIGENGKKIWTMLDKHGDFSLKLPTGQSYRVVIANQLPGGGQKVIGKLAVKNGKSATDVISAKKKGTIDLGVLRKPEVKSASSVATKSLHIDCGCDEGGGGDDWGGGGDMGGDMGGDWGGGGDGGWGDDGGWGGGAGGGDWGEEGGGWGAADGDWGGAGGWEGDWDAGGWDDAAGGWDDGGDMDPGEFDHGDDGACFGDDGAMIGDDDDDDAEGGDWGGAGGKAGADGDDGDFDPCNICVAGDPVDLVPSKGGYNDFVDLGGKLAPFDGDPCADVPTPTPTAPAASSSSSSGTVNAILGSSSASAKKDVGDKCQTKADVDTSVNMCVAGKVVKK